MKLTSIWVVSDPSPVSELSDILYQTTPERLPLHVIGTGANRWQYEHTTLYTNEAEARRDAESRHRRLTLAKRSR